MDLFLCLSDFSGDLILLELVELIFVVVIVIVGLGFGRVVVCAFCGWFEAICVDGMGTGIVLGGLGGFTELELWLLWGVGVFDWHLRSVIAIGKEIFHDLGEAILNNTNI